MNRRDFLKLLLTTLASASLSACAGAPALRPVPQAADAGALWDVIVIGAGAAGLRAAQKLQQNGRRVLILEARNRIGGRIWTEIHNGQPLDLGASWIHGIQANPITAIADQLGSPLIRTDYNDIQRFNADGEPLSAELDRRVGELLKRYFKLAHEYAEDQESDISLQAALEAALRTDPLDPQDLRLLNYAVNTTFEHEYAAASSHLSAWYFDQQDAPTGGDVIFRQGYRSTVDFLAQGLDIRLNQVVERIIYNDDGVAVEAAQQVWRARGALIAVPLGVLKAGSITFEPSLPAAKQQALERVGMGLLNKCYLIFPEVFWDDAALFGYAGERKGEWAEWINLDALLGMPVLLGFNAADYAHLLEAQSDEQIVDAAMQTLRIMYGKSIPAPLQYRITRWAADPYSLGSYSFMAVGASPADYDVLAQPVGKRLFFAGEHTHRNHPATVHGAYLSGERAADEILSLLQ